MSLAKPRHKKENDPLTRIQVVLTRSQLGMINEVSRTLHRNRSDVIREGIGEVLDRYSKVLKEQEL